MNLSKNVWKFYYVYEIVTLIITLIYNVLVKRFSRGLPPFPLHHMRYWIIWAYKVVQYDNYWNYLFWGLILGLNLCILTFFEVRIIKNSSNPNPFLIISFIAVNGFFFVWLLLVYVNPILLAMIVLLVGSMMTTFSNKQPYSDNSN